MARPRASLKARQIFLDVDFWVFAEQGRRGDGRSPRRRGTGPRRLGVVGVGYCLLFGSGLFIVG